MIAAAQGEPDGIDDPGQHVHGRKWNDLNSNGRHDPDEPGLAGVTVYSDLNNNGRLDDDEPSAVTMEDDPNTRFDETGLYWLEGLKPGDHVIREVVPAGFVPTFPGRHAKVTSSETGRFQEGIALDFDVTGVDIVPSPAADGTTIDLELTVVWPDSCGSVVTGMTTHNVVGNHILVQMHGEQVGNVCATVITPESQTIRIGDLEDNRYRVVGVLNEDLGDGGFVPTLAVVGGVAFEARGSHSLQLEPGEAVEGIDFGNHLRNPGSAHGVKWADRNGNGQRDPNEPGLPGVTIYSDLNFNGVLDDGEPRAVTMDDNPATAVDETGLYWLEDLAPGLHVIREVVPDGFVQTFPRRFPFDIGTVEPLQLPFPGGAHVIRVEPGQAVENLDFGNRRIEPGSVHGTKWMDRDGNGRRENNEPGLPGVVIYSDLNGNGRLDDDEPHTRTMEDDPDTAVDETGLYWLDLDPGRHVIREIVPDGFRQTFPPIGPIPLAEVGFAPDIFPLVGGAHVVFVEPGGVIEGRDFGNGPQTGSVHGRKWNDLDGDGRQDPDEPGLSGVTIYVDRNNNGQLDDGEQHTVTMEDDPITDFDEGGLYWLDGLPPGRHVVREVVPDGFVQTFPPHVAVPGDAGEGGGISSVDPDQIIVTLAAGEVFETQVSWSFDPLCVRPFEVDVVATDPDVSFENLTGVLLNGCGGDVSTFDVRMIGDGLNHFFEFQFVDAEFGGVLDVIPVTILAPSQDGGAHIIHIEPGGVVEDIDFGNHVQNEPGSIHGLKWNDLDGDGRRDPNEPGLPGVTIYVDRNNNGHLDDNERRTVTMEDDPVTAFDESGLYWLADLPPGEHVVREVVPNGYVPTFPERRAQVTSSQTGRFQEGVALDFDVTGVEIVPSTSADGTTIDLEMTVVWPDSCGSIVAGMTTHTVIGNHVLVEMSGEQVGTICAEVISPESQTIRISGLDRNRYRVVGVLSEDLGSGDFVPTLAVVGGVVFSADGGRHVVRLRPGETVEGIDFGNHMRKPGSAHGVKWADRNGNGQRDPNEPGLPGVTIFSDLNFNGVLDEGEPRTLTMDDDPNTAIDEAGLYWLENLVPGLHVIREIVPDGFVQTFPRRFPFDIGTVEPLRLPFPGGAHVIRVEPGQSVESLDFGNRRIEPGSVHGTKWLDLNGNGRREDNEPGLPGVVIYSDLNGNRRLDDDEPRTRTLEDDPDSAVDETGMYWLRLEPGRHVIREVVPDGFVQTFPPNGPIPLPFAEIGFAPDIFPWVGGAHVVYVEPGDVVEGLDFGNRRLLSGDFNGDGLLDCEDLRRLNEEIVAESHASAFDVNGDGRVNFGDTRFWISNIYGTILGDANLDFHVNAKDLNILGINWRQSGKHLFWCDADFNGDHVVNAIDLNVIALNWQSAAGDTATARTPRAPLHASATSVLVEPIETLRFASQSSLGTGAGRGEAVSDGASDVHNRFGKRIRRVDDYFARRNSQKPVRQSSPGRFERLADDAFADLVAIKSNESIRGL